MQIQLVDIGAPVKQGNLVKMKLKYLRDGKPTERNLVAIGKTKDVIQSLQECKPNDVVDIEMVKSDDGQFWNWVGLSKVDAAAPAAASTRSNSVQRTTYETPEERAKKQVYIVRQSSLTNAIEYFAHQGKKFSEKEVLDLARKFVSFVFSTDGQITVDEAVLEKVDMVSGELKDDELF